MISVYEARQLTEERVQSYYKVDLEQIEKAIREAANMGSSVAILRDTRLNEHLAEYLESLGYKVSMHRATVAGNFYRDDTYIRWS